MQAFFNNDNPSEPTVGLGLAREPEEKLPELGYKLTKRTYGLEDEVEIELNKPNMQRIAMGLFSAKELSAMAAEKSKAAANTKF